MTEMTMKEASGRTRPPRYLEVRGNFHKVSSLAFGGLTTLAVLWMFGGYGDALWWLFLIVAGFGAGQVWAYFMRFVFKGVFGIVEPTRETE